MALTPMRLMLSFPGYHSTEKKQTSFNLYWWRKLNSACMCEDVQKTGEKQREKEGIWDFLVEGKLKEKDRYSGVKKMRSH